MNPFSAIIRHFRRRKLIELECRVAGLTAKLKLPDNKPLLSPKPRHSYMKAIEITGELWEAKRMLQILSGEI